jgi:hypothetical protein
MEEKLKTLLKKIIEKNISNKAIWVRISNCGFRINIAKNAIEISSFEDADIDSCGDFRLSVRENENLIYALVADRKHTDIAIYGLLSRLYWSAKYVYYNGDETIESILKELESEKIIGKEIQ